MPVILKLLTVALFTCLSLTAYGEKLRIVTEPWAPYVYEEHGAMHGLDYETTVIVFQRLGIDVPGLSGSFQLERGTLLHFGMTIVGLDYGFAGQSGHDKVRGGSPYGATTIAGGKGERQPSKIELEGARHQGMLIAQTANKIFGT